MHLPATRLVVAWFLALAGILASIHTYISLLVESIEGSHPIFGRDTKVYAKSRTCRVYLSSVNI